MTNSVTRYRLAIVLILNKTPFQRARLFYPGVKYSEVKSLVQEVSLLDLAGALGLSVRTVHKICREYSGVIVEPGRCVHARKVKMTDNSDRVDEPQTIQQLFTEYIHANGALIYEVSTSPDRDKRKLKTWAEKFAQEHNLTIPENWDYV